MHSFGERGMSTAAVSNNGHSQNGSGNVGDGHGPDQDVACVTAFKQLQGREQDNVKHDRRQKEVSHEY